MVLSQALSLLPLSFSALFSSEAVSNTGGPQRHALSLLCSPFCTLPVKCNLVHCGLLAWFCCAAGQSEHGLDGGSWWMVFPEPYKASSSLLHWCVDATQLAAQWVCTVYCCGLTSRQMHMDAQPWKGLLCFFIVSIPLTLTTSLKVFLLFLLSSISLSLCYSNWATCNS